MKPKFIRIKRTPDNANWWNGRCIIGKTFEILDISAHNYAKIEYEEGHTGWLPIELHEVNPHLKIVVNRGDI